MRLTVAEGSVFEEFIAIYEDSIAARERKSRIQVQAMVARPDYRVLLFKRAGAVAGFSIVFLPETDSFSLLEYMAVAREFRNRGIGSELFLRSMRTIMEVRPGVLTLLEVDSDRENSPDRDLRRRRLAFYRRLGCLRMDGLCYALPLPGKGPPPEMDVLVHVPRPVAGIPRRQVERWLRTIYEQVYGCSRQDPRIAGMIGRLPDPVTLV